MASIPNTRRWITGFLPAAAAALVIMTGLVTGQADEDKPAEAAADGESSPAAAVLEVAGLTFTAGAPWKVKTPPRAMTRGGLTFVPAEDTDLEAVDADFFHFGGGQGGSVEANVARWINQFVDDDDRESEVTEKTLGDVEVSFVAVEGTYLDGPPFAPPAAKTKRPGFALAGVIIPRPDGPIFIKMTGPAKSVEAARADLEKLVADALGADPEDD